MVIAANAAVLGMILIHDADHVRQAYHWSYTIPGWLLVVNILVYVPSGLSLLATYQGHRSGGAVSSATVAELFAFICR